MLELLIIADDFTGALDTGVQFAGGGAETRVVTDRNYDYRAAEAGIQVLVMDAETRHLPAKEAYDVVYGIAIRGIASGIPYIYKKTDSALRGNIGSELEAALKASGEQVLSFVPALPRMNRITKGGKHYIDGLPVSQSVFGNDPFEPVTRDNVAEIIGLQSRIPVTIAEDPEQLSGRESGIVVYDALSEADIERIGAKLAASGQSRLLAGCAGFASILPELLGLERREPEAATLENRLFVICGSVNPITLRQMDTAEKAGFARLRLTPRQKLEPGYWASADGKAALAEIEQMLAANPRCIIETNDAGGNQLTADYAAARGIDLDGMRVGISGSVGQMFGALFGSEHLGTLLLTGGDTLLQCMNSVGARELEPVCELESGIVLARFTYQGRTRYVITKSGGFGQEDLLVELADRIAKH